VGARIFVADRKIRNRTEVIRNMPKTDEYQKELMKLTEIFAEIDPAKRELVQGLIEDAAFLKSENVKIKLILAETGMVLVHPTTPTLQKPVEASRQYLRNVNSYSVIIKTLNGILSKNIIDDDDGLDEFE
jgi:hypothetical protein